MEHRVPYGEGVCRRKYYLISSDYVYRMFNVPLKDAAFGTYLYDDFMSTLKKYAKKLDCPIEELHAQVDELVYDIEL